MSGISNRPRVIDPFGLTDDPALPSLDLAFDSQRAAEEFRTALPDLTGPDGRVSVKEIRVLRYKPGKRCVLEYDVKIRLPDGGSRKHKLIGKIRARRYGNEGYRLQRAIWDAGFQSDSTDGISVPEPVGVVPALRLWLQARVSGTTSGELLAGPDGVALARRIAEAAHKLHCAGVPTERVHTIADELRVLRECFDKLVREQPRLDSRITRLREACERLGSAVPAPTACGIHRDFYSAQVIVHRARLYLIDFDLYCLGDPALDIGNFLGHITEESLRKLGDPGALRDREQALEERFLELAGLRARAAMRAYTTLTLARHIFLSTQFPERASFTGRLVDLCEERLGIAAGTTWA